MNEKHGSNGFLLGLLIGGAVGALVSTKKGRQILKDLADYGVEYVGNTINMEDLGAMFNEDEEEMMKGEMEAEPSSAEATEGQGRGLATIKKKRLFRGIRKK